MRLWRAMVLLVAGSAVAAAQGTMPAHRVRVPETVMAGFVLSMVQPVYPPGTDASGDVVLHAVVGSDGVVKQVDAVSGPTPLQAPARAAVLAWRYRPYLLNGQPVEVETTMTVHLGSDAEAEAPASTGSKQAGSKQTGSTVIWAKPPALSAGTTSSGTTSTGAKAGTAATAPVRTGASVAGDAGRSGSAVVPAHGAISSSVVSHSAELSPPAKLSPPASVARSGGLPPPPGMSSSGGSRSTAGASRSAGLPPPAAIYSSPSVSPSVGRVVSQTVAPTEWRLVKKVPPVYPVEAADAGIEGVVVVAGVVRKDGLLHDLRAVSGPIELQQAAINAASQWQYEAKTAYADRTEAPTSVSVDFLLKGPVRVPADVMAGRIEDSFIPVYPAAAQAAGVSGTVTLQALIGREGQVEQLSVISGPAMLRETALDTVKHWRYKPYLRNGVDLEVETTVLVSFRLP
jgi:TonB family protein